MCKMIHKSQKPIKYYFFKKDISLFNCTENHTKETVIYFILCNIYTLHPYLMTAEMKNS